MHIYFSGIGGVGLGPLAQIALDAGYEVSGSDGQDSPMYQALLAKGAVVHLGQSNEDITRVHSKQPIDWLVYTSALPEDHPELLFAAQHSIKTSKRDELLATIIREKNLKLLAVAGTHGKTTTTAMLVWLLRQLHIPVSYSIGTQISFGPSGAYDPASEFFVYECDEFDRNFLNFTPAISLITNIDYDHPDTYPTETSYLEAFAAFVAKSEKTVTWQEYSDKLPQDHPAETVRAINRHSDVIRDEIASLPLVGQHNRENGYLAKTVLEEYLQLSGQDIIDGLATFPGTARRFEKLADNLYSDYAHHPTEIRATLQLAREISTRVIAVYQPHQNIRQHDVAALYDHSFDGIEKVYWLPTYLSREDPTLAVLSPEELSARVTTTPTIVSSLSDGLWEDITEYRNNGALVLLMGAGDIDPWARRHLALDN